MKSERPEIIAINNDDYIAKYVGHTSDRRQFFVTTPFVGAHADKPGAEFLALYIFDPLGKLAEARIEHLGPRATLDKEKVSKLRQKWLDDLGPIRFYRIEVAPFSVVRFGIEFGLVLWEPEDDDAKWQVTMEPGNYMAFFEPWDSGEYDT